LRRIFYADSNTRRIAEEIASSHGVEAELFRINNPTFHVWGSWLRGQKVGDHSKSLPRNSYLIGGNRWRHHFALNLTSLPVVSIDAHTDMNYDEMIPLKLVRPYNWLYFRMLQGSETHLVLPYSNFRGGRWNIVVPDRQADQFHLYSFDRKRSRTDVSLSLRRSRAVDIAHVEDFPPIVGVSKQVSLDWDVVREVPEDRVVDLLARIVGKDDVCDIWLDEGRRGRRNSLKDHVRYCSRVYEILNND
jgi:hypothetical protein